MSEIPDDIMRLAREVEQECVDKTISAPASEGRDICETVIARALLAEREAQRERFERLVKIVPVVSDPRYAHVCDDILDAWADGVACAKREITAAIRAEAI